MVIVIDVGNSRIKLGLFDNTPAPKQRLPDCLRSTAVDVDAALPWDELGGWVDAATQSVEKVFLGGVNPRGRDKVIDSWPISGWPHPIIIDNPFMLPIEIRTGSPRSVGVDRLLNAIAGNVIRPPDRAMIIIDSGTATTVDVVSADGAFIGGAILPGFQIGSQALHQYTALLPLIANQELAERLPDPLGKNTRDALKSGLFWGQLGAVKELVAKLSEQLPPEPMVLVSGGAGRLLAPELSRNVLHKPFLALQGLVLVGHHLDRETNGSREL